MAHRDNLQRNGRLQSAFPADSDQILDSPPASAFELRFHLWHERAGPRLVRPRGTVWLRRASAKLSSGIDSVSENRCLSILPLYRWPAEPGRASQQVRAIRLARSGRRRGDGPTLRRLPSRLRSAVTLRTDGCPRRRAQI